MHVRRYGWSAGGYQRKWTWRAALELVFEDVDTCGSQLLADLGREEEWRVSDNSSFPLLSPLPPLPSLPSSPLPSLPLPSPPSLPLPSPPLPLVCL